LFAELMQRIFKCGDMQYLNFTPEKKLNSLSVSYAHVQTLKTVLFVPSCGSYGIHLLLENITSTSGDYA